MVRSHIPLTQHAEQDGEVVFDEISDLKQRASDVADKVAVDATPLPPIEVATGTDGNWNQERALAQETAATITPNKQTEQDGEVILNELPDLKRPATDLADKIAMDTTSVPSLEIAMVDDGEWGLERDEAELAPNPTPVADGALRPSHRRDRDRQAHR